ncbi:hypothetical protein HK097_004658, partial [Rhizophlyctis rosea]
MSTEELSEEGTTSSGSSSTDMELTPQIDVYLAGTILVGSPVTPPSEAAIEGDKPAPIEEDNSVQTDEDDAATIEGSKSATFEEVEAPPEEDATLVQPSTFALEAYTSLQKLLTQVQSIPELPLTSPTNPLANIPTELLQDHATQLQELKTLETRFQSNSEALERHQIDLKDRRREASDLADKFEDLKRRASEVQKQMVEKEAEVAGIEDTIASTRKEVEEDSLGIRKCREKVEELREKMGLKKLDEVKEETTTPTSKHPSQTPDHQKPTTRSTSQSPYP